MVNSGFSLWKGCQLKYEVTPKKITGIRYYSRQFRSFFETAFFGSRENLDFGNLFIMNEYAEVPIGTKILGRLQHGSVPLNAFKADYNNNFHTTYVWNHDAEIFAINHGWNNYHTIGAPWIYFLEIQKSMGMHPTLFETREIRSIDELWIYGNHSNYMDDGFESGLGEFLSAASESQAAEKVILLFWYDYVKLSSEIRRQYPQLRILTLGDRAKFSTANAHLFQLHGLLTRSKSVVIDFPSTPFFYALSVGCSVTWLKNSSFASGFEKAKSIKNNELVEAMSKDVVLPPECQQLVRDNLGMNHMRTPEEIRLLFHWNSRGLNPVKAIKLIMASIFSAPIRYSRRLK
jgi:hypothetical protein